MPGYLPAEPHAALVALGLDHVVGPEDVHLVELANQLVGALPVYAADDPPDRKRAGVHQRELELLKANDRGLATTPAAAITPTFSFSQ